MPTAPVDAMATLHARTISLAELRATGMTRRDITRAVDGGHLLRLRNGRYAHPDIASELQAAGSMGARLDCLSLLRLVGVFVRESSALHVQVEPHSSRHQGREHSAILHWRASEQRPCALASDIVSAVAQAVRCQRPRDAIATLDSALNQGLLDELGLAEVFSRLPRRLRRLGRLVDGRAESGPETLVRLLLRALGCELQLQVTIPRIGRVDIVVNGWLIVECDSRAHHDGWEAHRRDRRRDVEAAALGYTTVRLLAEDVLYRHDDVVALMKRILTHPHPAVQNSVG